MFLTVRNVASVKDGTTGKIPEIFLGEKSQRKVRPEVCKSGSIDPGEETGTGICSVSLLAPPSISEIISGLVSHIVSDSHGLYVLRGAAVDHTDHKIELSDCRFAA